MIVDSITEEIRAIRQSLAAKYDNDLGRIFEAVRESERLSGREFVTLPKRPVRRPIGPKKSGPYEPPTSGEAESPQAS